jgi:hypothetical protein
MLERRKKYESSGTSDGPPLAPDTCVERRIECRIGPLLTRLPSSDQRMSTPPSTCPRTQLLGRRPVAHRSPAEEVRMSRRDVLLGVPTALRRHATQPTTSHRTTSAHLSQGHPIHSRVTFDLAPHLRFALGHARGSAQGGPGRALGHCDDDALRALSADARRDAVQLLDAHNHGNLTATRSEARRRYAIGPRSRGNSRTIALCALCAMTPA